MTWVQVHPLAPEISVDISFSTDPGDTPSWESVSDRVRGLSTRLYRQSERDEFETGELFVTLDNLDRELDPTNTASGWYPDVLPRRRIRYQARWNAVTYDRFYGFIRSINQQWQPQPDAVAVVSAADYGLVLNRAQVDILAYPEELASARITRVLDAIGVPAGDRSIATATYTVAAGDVGAETDATERIVNALEHCRQCAQSDGGYLFIGRDGKITFHDRYYRLTNESSPAGVFDDDGTDIPYTPGMFGAHDDSRLWNRAAIITADGTREEASDSTSETTYWPARRDDWQGLHAYPGEAAALASMLVWRNKDVSMRFPQISTVLLQTDTMSTAEIATLLAADVGTRFTITRRPPGGGSAITEDVHIEGISEDISPGSAFTLTFNVSPAEPAPTFWVLGTHAFNSTAALGY